MLSLLLTILLVAFEPQSESPWLSGGVATVLFPRSHLGLSLNPASVGLLETGISASASRPFGFRELDRSAIAVGKSTDRMAFAGLFSYSGRDGYSEVTGTGAIAIPLRAGIVAGISASCHRLQIQGFGSAVAFSTDVGVIARPVKGVFFSGAVKGLYSSSLTETGMGAVPIMISGSAGICPIEGITVSAGAAFHEYAGEEYSFVTSVEPYPTVALFFSIQTPPVRLGMGLEVSISTVAVQYGYGTHPVLPGGHAMSLSYGNPAFRPEPVQISQSLPDQESVTFPININTATEEQLIEIPGIGPSKASTIINYIETFGPFQSVDQMIDIPGVGTTTLENLKPYLTV